MKRITAAGMVMAISAMVAMAGCGSSGSGTGTSAGAGTSGGTGATGAAATVSKGVVTGFGSVFVNNVEYKTAGAKVYKPDTSTAPDTMSSSETDVQGKLKLGMVVTVKGSSDGTSGQAVEIEYKDNLEGKVTAVDATAGTLTVLGITVSTDSNTRIYGAASLAAIAAGNWVEVSGIPDNTGVLKASFIEAKGTTGSEQEIKGFVVASNAGSFDFGLIAGVKAATYAATLPAGIPGGSFIEVKFDAAGAVKSAEINDDIVKADSGTARMEAEGYITALSGSNATVSVNGKPQAVTLTDTTIFEGGTKADLAVGRKIEAEGPVDAGVITARKVKIYPVGSKS